MTSSKTQRRSSRFSRVCAQLEGHLWRAATTHTYTGGQSYGRWLLPYGRKSNELNGKFASQKSETYTRPPETTTFRMVWRRRFDGLAVCTPLLQILASCRTIFGTTRNCVMQKNSNHASLTNLVLLLNWTQYSEHSLQAVLDRLMSAGKTGCCVPLVVMLLLLLLLATHRKLGILDSTTANK